MAQIQFGAIITDLKGKIGGQVFQGGNRCKVLKNSRYTAGRQTSFKTKNTNNIELVSTEWRDRSQAQRNAWQAASADWVFYDKYGNAYTGSGYQYFLALNTNSLNIQVGIYDNPPSPVTPENTAERLFSWTIPLPFNLDTTATTTESQVIQVYASRPLGVGIANSTAKLQFIKSMFTDIDSYMEMETEYVARYGYPPAGSKIVIKSIIRPTAYPYGYFEQLTSIIVS